MKKIPYSKQNISEEDIESVCSILRSDYLTQGPVIENFEARFRGLCGVNHAVATNSATSALHLACLSLGVGAGDIVWTSPITFVASANCAAYCGAYIDFVDIDPKSYNMSVEGLEKKLVEAEMSGKLPKVVIPVHMCGQPCEMAEIYRLAERYGFSVIEDASHAVGAAYRGSLVGSCEFSQITIFSFHPVKIITTGEGGMAVTNDTRLYSRMKVLRSHGILRNGSEAAGRSNGPWFYDQVELGFNFRMSDIHAALGISQLLRLNNFIQERRRLASVYDKLIPEGIAEVPWRHPDSYSTFHLYVIRLNLKAIKSSQKEVYEYLHSHGIFVQLHYIPVYRHSFYRSMGHSITSFPNAEDYYARAVSLPLYPGLEPSEQQEIVQQLIKSAGCESTQC